MPRIAQAMPGAWPTCHWLCRVAPSSFSNLPVLPAVRKPLTFAPMIVSRITSKAQTTIPRAVRAALGLQQGDEVRYEIDGDRVILTRAEAPDPFPNPFFANFSTFTEWADEADQRVYAGL